MPTGGTTGQVLAKSSATNFATAWVDPAAGVGAGYYEGPTAPDPVDFPLWFNTTDGAFLVYVGTTWVEPGANFIPPGGTVGQMAVKASGDDFDLEWVDPPAAAVQNVFIQQTEPVAAPPWIWYQTDALGNVIDILKG